MSYENPQDAARRLAREAAADAALHAERRHLIERARELWPEQLHTTGHTADARAILRAILGRYEQIPRKLKAAEKQLRGLITLREITEHKNADEAARIDDLKQLAKDLPQTIILRDRYADLREQSRKREIEKILAKKARKEASRERRKQKLQLRAEEKQTAPQRTENAAKRYMTKTEKEAFYLSREWAELRYEALRTNGRKCQCCGAEPPRVVLHVDHIQPISKHPELRTSLENLQVLCSLCNRGKSNKYMDDWRATENQL